MSRHRHVQRSAARHWIHTPLLPLKSQRASYISYALWKTMHTNGEADKAKSSFFEAFDADSSMREVSSGAFASCCIKRSQLHQLNFLFMLQQVVHSLSFTNDNLENDLASDGTFPLLNNIMTWQLLNSYSTLKSPSSVHHVGRTVRVKTRRMQGKVIGAAAPRSRYRLGCSFGFADSSFCWGGSQRCFDELSKSRKTISKISKPCEGGTCEGRNGEDGELSWCALWVERRRGRERWKLLKAQ